MRRRAVYLRDEMAIYDALRPGVRKLVADATFRVPVREVAAALDQGATVDDVAALLAEVGRRVHADGLAALAGFGDADISCDGCREGKIHELSRLS